MDDKDFIRFLTSMREFNVVEPIESIYRLNQIRKKEAKPLQKVSFCRGLASSGHPLIEIICYCLNFNHYHILLKQLSDRGIEKFMQRLNTGYTMYFNNRYNRSGSLFQGTFKAIHIKSDSHKTQLSCYINGNAEIHKIPKAKNWK